MGMEGAVQKELNWLQLVYILNNKNLYPHHMSCSVVVVLAMKTAQKHVYIAIGQQINSTYN